ncbi:hypothetical protein [Brevundimonas sp.]|uniref:hypothetical protein n=1 Tax=Brevundimonas sp. TaxID=1871086 RepID=UPI00257F9F28|nr:hypothetical protein [Brevundimonas sp.]
MVGVLIIVAGGQVNGAMVTVDTQFDDNNSVFRAIVFRRSEIGEIGVAKPSPRRRRGKLSGPPIG